MDQRKHTVCRTCLDSATNLRNLCFLKYNHLLELLNRILGFKIKIEDDVFNICESCESSLTWMLEFIVTCEKSLNTIENEAENEHKTNDFIKSEPSDDVAQHPDFDVFDGDNEFLPENNSESSAQEVDEAEPPRRRITNLKKRVKNDKLPANVKLRRTKYKQYSAELIQQAITESSSFITDIKTRKCLHCTFEGAISTVLSCHMHKSHVDLLKSWCNRCNVQTDDLQGHKNTVLCSENRCRFCHKKCKTTNSLATHLKLHCHAFFKESNNDNKGAIISAIDTPTTIWFKEDPFTENADIIDTFKEEIKERNEKLPWRMRKLLKSVDTVNKNEPEEIEETSVKPYRLQQFSLDEVEKVLKYTMRSYHVNRKCIICDEELKNAAMLSVHMKKLHKTTQNNWCSKCNALVENLEEHAETHNMTCVFCNEVFTNLAYFKNHIKGHSASSGNLESTWTCCKFCGTAFPTEDDFKNHQCTRSKIKNKIGDTDDEESENEEDSTNRVYDQVKTTYRQVSAEEVQEAIDDTRTVVKESRNCVICGHLAMKSLFSHMQRTHTEVIHQWCSMCNTFPENISEHIKSHENILHCKFCDKIYTKIYDLRTHLKCHAQSANISTDVKWFSCIKCKKLYTSQKRLNEHPCELLKPENSEKVVQLKPCKVCSKSVPNLRVHMRQEHRPKKMPTQRLCPFCGKVYLRNYDLTIHVRTHTGEKPFKCAHCDKQFNIRRSLQVHERRHLGVKRHICHVCAKAFVTVVELQAHSRIHDTRVISEQCEICNKSFSRPGLLQIHIYKKHRGKQLHKMGRPPPKKVARVNQNQEETLNETNKDLPKEPTESLQMLFEDIC